MTDKTIERKVVLFIATSVDGYIAKPNDDLRFLKLVEKEGEDYGYAEFIAEVDTLLIGRRTYEYVCNEIGSTYYEQGDREVYVFTRTARPAAGKITFYSGKITDLIEKLKSQPGKNIYCDGGAGVIHELLLHDLIDEMIISVIPVLLGEGIRLFRDNRPEQLLELVSAKTYETGLTQLHYKRKREKEKF